MLVALLSSFILAADLVLAIWPQPQHLSTGTTTLLLSPAFEIQFERGPVPADVHEVTDRALKSLRDSRSPYLSVQQGREFKIRSASIVHCLRVSLQATSWTDLVEDVTADHAHAADEYYELKLDADGSARLVVNTTLGLLRGLTTWEQLWYAMPARCDERGAAQITFSSPALAFAPFAPYEIWDSPHFYWRGLMVDTSRHFIPTDLLKSTIDGMMLAKLNKLHCELSRANLTAEN